MIPVSNTDYQQFAKLGIEDHIKSDWKASYDLNDKQSSDLDDVVSLDGFSVGSGGDIVGARGGVQHEHGSGLGDRSRSLFGNFGLKQG